MTYEGWWGGGWGQFDYPTSGKTTLKNPNLIRVKGKIIISGAGMLQQNKHMKEIEEQYLKIVLYLLIIEVK